jgi:hypothetical protein
MHLFIWEQYGGEIFQSYGENVMLGEACGPDGAEAIFPHLGGRRRKQRERLVGRDEPFIAPANTIVIFIRWPVSLLVTNPLYCSASHQFLFSHFAPNRWPVSNHKIYSFLR